jgi:hypothetical protein
MVCIADHYEPGWGGADFPRQASRVARWRRDLPALARRHVDADGVCLQYTFFYPEEEYHPAHLDALAQLCRAGLGDVEVHLHHDHDTSAGLREKLMRFTRILYHRHGLLRRTGSGRIEYAFIHGNWALDNSGEDGRFCGVNDELQVLRDTGCYADLTFPSAPDRSQPPTINRIYYATDDPVRSRSHDTGTPARAGQTGAGDLLMIQGPLTLNWRSRSRGVLPRIENGELSADNPPTPQRADLWVRQHVHVEGRPEWVFVKLHTHGANERHTAVLLGPPLERTLRHLEARYNDGVRYRLHYVTAREMCNIVKAAEAGHRGNAGAFRRFGEESAESAPMAKAAR